LTQALFSAILNTWIIIRLWDWRNVCPNEIKKAYRKLASQITPIKEVISVAFQRIEEAYRTRFVRYKRQQMIMPFKGMHGFPLGFQFHTGHMDINDIFGQMFGQSSSFYAKQTTTFKDSG